VRRCMNKRKPKASPKKPNDLEPVFARLKQILESCKEGWVVKGDPQRYTYLESASAVCRGRPLWFGAVRIGKNYVSFHLMPVYACPEFLKGMSPKLKRRMQGKVLAAHSDGRAKPVPTTDDLTRLIPAVKSREPKREGGSLAQLTLDEDGPVHSFDHVLDDAQTESGAANVARARLVHAVKALEDT